MSVGVGDQFTVAKEHEVEEGGRLVARYLVDHRYRITPRNLDLVLRLIDEKKAAPILGEKSTPANQLSGPQSRVRGSVSISATEE